MSEFNTKKIYTTAPGVAIWPKLIEPETKFNPDGTYVTRLRHDEATEQKFMEWLTEQYDEAYPYTCKLEKKAKLKQGPKPWTAEQVKDEEGVYHETGRQLFTFKMNATGKTKDGKVYTQRPVIFDANGNKIKDVAALKIGGGSIFRVAFTIRPFFTALVGAGISLKLKSVQIVKLVTYGERSAEEYGFGKVEGGFAQDTSEDAPEAPQAPLVEGDGSEDF